MGCCIIHHRWYRGMIAVVINTLFPSTGSGDDPPSCVRTITGDISSGNFSLLRRAFLHCHNRTKKKNSSVETAATEEVGKKQGEADLPIAASKEEEPALPTV